MANFDPVGQMGSDIAQEITPAGNPVFSWLGQLVDQLMQGANQRRRQAPPQGPLPRIVQQPDGSFIDLNTNSPVGNAPRQQPQVPQRPPQPSPQQNPGMGMMPQANPQQDYLLQILQMLGLGGQGPMR